MAVVAVTQTPYYPPAVKASKVVPDPNLIYQELLLLVSSPAISSVLLRIAC